MDQPRYRGWSEEESSQSDAAPRGGVRPFHQKSTCITQSTLERYVVQIWSRNTLKCSPNETFEAHCVDLRESVHPSLSVNENYYKIGSY